MSKWRGKCRVEEKKIARGKCNFNIRNKQFHCVAHDAAQTIYSQSQSFASYSAYISFNKKNASNAFYIKFIVNLRKVSFIIIIRLRISPFLISFDVNSIFYPRRIQVSIVDSHKKETGWMTAQNLTRIIWIPFPVDIYYDGFYMMVPSPTSKENQ